VKEGTHKALLGIEKKPSKMEDDEWNRRWMMMSGTAWY